MASVILEGIFINILSSIIYDIGKIGFRKFLSTSPVKAAINETSKHFPSQTSVKESLEKWCQSDEFIEQIQKLSGTIEQINVDLLVNSFIHTGGFFDDINMLNPHRMAQEVLDFFFQNLEEQLLKSEHAGKIAEVKANIRFKATQISLENLSEQSRKETEEVKNHTTELFSKYIPNVDIDSLPAVQEKLFFKEVDIAVDLLKKGKVETALSQLNSLRARLVGQDVSANLHFRIAANAGICLIQMDKWEEAKPEFEHAYKLKAENKLVLSYLALVASFENNAARAEELANQLLPAEENKSVITSHFIRVTANIGRFDVIDKLVKDEEWVTRDPNCAISLGLLKFAQGNYEESEIYFRTATSAEDENPHAFRLLAQTIIVPLDKIILQNPPLRISEDMSARYREAKDNLTKAVNIFEKREETPNLIYSLLQRAYVSDMLGEPDESLKDCEWILRIDPDNGKALRQKGQTFLYDGDTQQALDSFGRIKDKQSRDEAILAMALGYSRIGNYEEVLTLLADKFDLSDHSRQQAILIDMLLMAYHFLEKPEDAKGLVENIDSERPSDPEMLVLTARHFYRNKQIDQAYERYQKALENAAVGNQTDRIQLEVAEAYYSDNQWGKAAELYAGKVDEEVDFPIARRFLISLYNSGARDRALHLAIKLRAANKAISFVSEIEAGIYADLGEYEKALNLFDELYELDKTNLDFLFDKVDMLDRLERYEDAAQLIERIKFDDIKNNAQALIRVAGWRSKLSIGDELSFAYQARRVAFNKADVHMAYLQLFLERDKESDDHFDSLITTVDTVIYLKPLDSSEVIALKIIEDDNFDITRGEIHANDPRVSDLLGLSVGEAVVFNEGQLNESRYEVVEVKHKYVDAFQETLKKSNEWFAFDNSVSGNPITTIKVGDDNFSNLFKLLAADRQKTKSILGIFNKGNLPIITLARFLGKSYFDTWYSVIAASEEKIYSIAGGPSDRDQELLLAKRSKGIVIDLSALLTMSFLGLLEKLPVAFASIKAPLSVLETLKKWKTTVDKAQPHEVVWEEDGQLVYREVTAETLANRRFVIDEMISFVEAHVECLPATKVLTIPSEKLGKYHQAFGKNFHSIMLATELNVPIYVDDRQLAVVLNDLGYQTQQISVQSILLKFQSMGLISSVEYCSLLKQLILANYFYISVNAENLTWMLRDEKNQVTGKLKKIIEISLGKFCEPVSAITVGTGFLYLACLRVADQGEKVKIVDLTLAALLSSRNDEATVSALKRALAMQFQYSNHLLEFVLERLTVHQSF